MPAPSDPSLFDPARLAAIRRAGILDTPAEPRFDDIVTLAKHICRTPVALISFVTDQRQWFKASAGFGLRETPLNQSVCAHAVTERAMLVIPDLTRDPRTADNPLVTGPPHIRFYAGAPLESTDGHVLGTVCVLDAVPRPEGLAPAEAGALAALARQVAHLVELREVATRREAEEQRYRMIFDAINAAFCVVQVKFDGTGRAVDYQFLEVNAAFEADLGLGDASGRWMRSVTRDHEDDWFEQFGQVARSGKAVRFERFVPAVGRWFEVHAFPAGSQDQHQVGVLFNDITARRQARELIDETEDRFRQQQAVLNEELSHRLKNSLAMVQAIATQTLRAVPDQEPVEAFIRRLHALSTAHDVLLQQDWSAAPLAEVVGSVLQAVSEPARFDVGGPAVGLGSRATLSTSLLIHELATNAIKHGSLSRAGGRVRIAWRLGTGEEGEALVLTWRETGGPPAEAPSRKGFGSKLIRMGLVGTGGVELRYSPSGFEADFTASLAQLRLP